MARAAIYGMSRRMATCPCQPAALTGAIERLADDGLRAELAAGARERREELSWETTKDDLAQLLAVVAPAGGAR